MTGRSTSTSLRNGGGGVFLGLGCNSLNLKNIGAPVMFTTASLELELHILGVPRPVQDTLHGVHHGRGAAAERERGGARRGQVGLSAGGVWGVTGRPENVRGISGWGAYHRAGCPSAHTIPSGSHLDHSLRDVPGSALPSGWRLVQDVQHLAAWQSRGGGWAGIGSASGAYPSQILPKLRS